MPLRQRSPELTGPITLEDLRAFVEMTKTYPARTPVRVHKEPTSNNQFDPGGEVTITVDEL